MPRLSLENQRLTGKQKKDFCDALLSAYPTPAAFDQMLQFNLDRRLADLSLASDMPTIVFDVINKAESKAWSRQLLDAALISSPDNPELLHFSRQFELAPNSSNQECSTIEEKVLLSREEAQSLQVQLASLLENLRLIEERKAEYVESTDIPLTLLKNERKLRTQIIEVESKFRVASTT